MASRFAPSLFMHLLFTQSPPVATLMLEKNHSALCWAKDKRGRRAASSASRERKKKYSQILFPHTCWELELGSHGPKENAAHQLSISYFIGSWTR